ncbi:MAG: serine hydrolase [Lachnospiraceae bacterium]
MREDFERVSPESVGIPSSAIEKFIDALELGDFTEPHGLMIMRYGKICAEGWWYPYTAGKRHVDNSLTKTYAATAIGIAVREGILSLDEKILDIFSDVAPSNPSAYLQELCVHHVLSMSNGMERMPESDMNWIAEYLKTEIIHKPGTQFMYNTVGSNILAAIIQRKAGCQMTEYLTHRLFDKIGIDVANIKCKKLADGTQMGGGGLFTTTEDNLRLMKLYADKGVCNGERILDETFVTAATTVQITTESVAEEHPECFDAIHGYGYQIWINRDDISYRADGALGQYSIVFPEYDMIIAINESGKMNGLPTDGPHETLNHIYNILLPEIVDVALPEDAKCYKKFKRKMQTLCLPVPPYCRNRKSEAHVHSKEFTTKKGAYTLLPEFKYFGDLQNITNGIEKISFYFDNDQCEILVKESGKDRRVTVGMDGTIVRNRYAIEGAEIDEVYINGFWRSDKEFVIQTRWTENCQWQEITFLFQDNQVQIHKYFLSGSFMFNTEEYATAFLNV